MFYKKAGKYYRSSEGKFPEGDCGCDCDDIPGPSRPCCDFGIPRGYTYDLQGIPVTELDDPPFLSTHRLDCPGCSGIWVDWFYLRGDPNGLRTVPLGVEGPFQGFNCVNGELIANRLRWLQIYRGDTTDPPIVYLEFNEPPVYERAQAVPIAPGDGDDLFDPYFGLDPGGGGGGVEPDPGGGGTLLNDCCTGTWKARGARMWQSYFDFFGGGVRRECDCIDLPDCTIEIKDICLAITQIIPQPIIMDLSTVDLNNEDCSECSSLAKVWELTYAGSFNINTGGLPSDLFRSNPHSACGLVFVAEQQFNRHNGGFLQPGAGFYFAGGGTRINVYTPEGNRVHVITIGNLDAPNFFDPPFQSIDGLFPMIPPPPYELTVNDGNPSVPLISQQMLPYCSVGANNTGEMRW